AVGSAIGIVGKRDRKVGELGERFEIDELVGVGLVVAAALLDADGFVVLDDALAHRLAEQEAGVDRTARVRRRVAQPLQELPHHRVTSTLRMTARTGYPEVLRDRERRRVREVEETLA